MAHVYPTGIFFSSGSHWRVARQFTVRTLQSLGVRQPPLVDKVLRELACLKEQLDSYGGEWGDQDVPAQHLCPPEASLPP